MRPLDKQLEQTIGRNKYIELLTRFRSIRRDEFLIDNRKLPVASWNTIVVPNPP